MVPSLILLVVAAQRPLPMQWAQFSRMGALSRVSETVDVATGFRSRGSAFPYRLRLTEQKPGTAPAIKWADSETCPAIRIVVADMSRITMPRPAPYGLPDQSTTLAVDGTEYSLSAPSSDAMGRMTISSNVGSSLAAWVDSALERLAPCWTAVAPQ